MLNTVVLLSSGVRVTWAHHSLLCGAGKDSIAGLVITVLLGFYFTFLQAMEYFECRFSLRDGVYGTTFFVATGFHGLHVIIGRLFLGVCLYRCIVIHFRRSHHLGFEAAAWY